jgi:hypothetical protein
MRWLILLIIPLLMGADLTSKDSDYYTNWCADASIELCLTGNRDVDYVNDDSGKGRIGSFNGNAATTTGKESNGWVFDGTDDYINVGNINMANWTGFAFVAWVKWTDDDGAAEEHLGSNWGAAPHFLFRVDPNSNVLEAQLFTENVTTVGGAFSTTMPSSEWVHVALTYDKVSMKAYINGVLDDTSYARTTNLENTASSNDVWIGSTNHVNEDFTGDMDEVAIFSRSLSQFEIIEIMNNGLK